MRGGVEGKADRVLALPPSKTSGVVRRAELIAGNSVTGMPFSEEGLMMHLFGC